MAQKTESWTVSNTNPVLPPLKVLVLNQTYASKSRLNTVLAQLGCETVYLFSADEAFEVTCKERFNLLIIDPTLKDRDGNSALATLSYLTSINEAIAATPTLLLCDANNPEMNTYLRLKEHLDLQLIDSNSTIPEITNCVVDALTQCLE